MILTQAQTSLLSDLSGGPQLVSETYPPLMKLLSLSFAEIETEGRLQLNSYRITDAGREALAAINK